MPPTPTPKTATEFLTQNLTPVPLKDLDPNDSCPICTESYYSLTPIRITSCSHIFCRSCIETWVRSGRGNANTCPSCRGVLFEPRRWRRTTGRVGRQMRPSLAHRTTPGEIEARIREAREREGREYGEDAEREGREVREVPRVHRRGMGGPERRSGGQVGEDVQSLADLVEASRRRQVQTRERYQIAREELRRAQERYQRLEEIMQREEERIRMEEERIQREEELLERDIENRRLRRRDERD